MLSWHTTFLPNDTFYILTMLHAARRRDVCIPAGATTILDRMRDFSFASVHYHIELLNVSLLCRYYFYGEAMSILGLVVLIISCCISGGPTFYGELMFFFYFSFIRTLKYKTEFY